MHFVHVIMIVNITTSGLIKGWLKRKRIQTVPWPPYSPGFNPNEIWDKLEQRVEKHQPKNFTQL